MERSPQEVVLGDAFVELPATVRNSHVAPLRANGSLDVVHGKGALARLLVFLLKLPRSGIGQAIQLEIMSTPGRVVWRRDMGGRELRTVQSARNGRLVECSGLGCIRFLLKVEGGELCYVQESMTFLGVRLPTRLSPVVAGRVREDGDGWAAKVAVTFRGRLMCEYVARMKAR